MRTLKLPTPSLSLVGAGPGDPELITLKGIRTLQRADVVLYDALTHPELLEHAPTQAKQQYVGKRAGRHSLSQEQINALIVELAQRHGHVVRLKGGDPLVFGRGLEEIEYARAHGLETRVVPGLSSVTAVTSLNQLALTHRGLSESVWVVTATTKTGELSADLHAAVQSRATVVVLMGMRKIAQIAALYEAAGRGDLPAALIQSGSLPAETFALGNVRSLPALAEAEGIGSPGLIVLGETVGKHPAFVRELPGLVSQPQAQPILQSNA